VQHVIEAENKTQRMKKTNLPVYFVDVQLSYNIYIVWEGCRLERNKQIYYYYYYYLQDSTTQKILILFLQEVKHDIIFLHAHLTTWRRQEELPLHIQAHLLLVVNKIYVLLEY
jgi:hypothetical protein